MIVSAILAVSNNDVIGIDNNLPWHLSDDLKFFKKTTLNEHIIMGRKSYESIGRPLPKRINIIVSRNENYKAEGCIVVNSIQKALDFAYQNGVNKAFIIGGATIYDQAFDQIDRFYITKVDCVIEGGSAFFELDRLKNWKLIDSEFHAKDAKNEFNFMINIYER